MPEFGVRFPVSAVWKKQKMFLPHPGVKVSIVGSLRDQEVLCSASDRQGSNFESCVWRTVSSQSSHHPQEVLLAQFSLYVHKGGLKPDSFHFYNRHHLSELSIFIQHQSWATSSRPVLSNQINQIKSTLLPYYIRTGFRVYTLLVVHYYI